MIRPLHVVVDAALLFIAWWIAFWLRFNLDMPAEFIPVAWVSLPWMLAANLGILIFGNVYRQVWRYVSLSELRQLGVCVAIGGATTAALVLMQRYEAFPRTVLVLHPLLAVLFLGGVRVAWRMQTERGFPAVAQMRPLLIIGALSDAAAALRALKGSHHWEPVGILTPQPEDRGRWLQNVPVLGTIEMIAQAGQLAGASTALVASPPGSPQRREALLKASGSGVTLLTMRRADEWLQHDPAEPRKVEIDDLLGRDPVQLDVAGLAELFSGQTVLVTGAGGSIGSELCRQVSRFGVGKLVCVDVSEYAVYQLEQELQAAHPRMHGVYYTANVREVDRLRAIMQRHRPAVVLHAAAYKHVPLMEEHNEIEALRTNVAGTLHAARLAGECGTRRFVLISTDKAVNPTNVMGASKRLAEMMVQALAARYPDTRYVSVRFGNVLGSSGSVVPRFTTQIARGGPVTVTHPEIVRYFMTIPEAAQLVLQAGLMGRSGQIFVMDMGEPMKILELARMLIRLSGKTEQDIPITFTGLRPGEKLYEELLADDETTEPTPHPKLRVAKTAAEPRDEEAVLRWIEDVGPEPPGEQVREWLRAQVPEYGPGNGKP
ncbi:capsule biosynthesis protein CapD [Ramlibacter tataouinensis]|uniref:Capsule biosynthesis protein CapD n=1 Tax=Ramlibacter tataouinensis TaxID=94132 RepID=A0A127JZ45_9BURK|nr:capsule biosynthesis protein CapD [Ramlibacter tataouinensis]